MSKKQTPSEFLKLIIGRPVVVKLNSGVDYRGILINNKLSDKWQILVFIYGQKKKGILVCLDGYMNIALEQTEEYINGQLKNKYGDAFIRGNNVLYISTQKRRV